MYFLIYIYSFSKTLASVISRYKISCSFKISFSASVIFNLSSISDEFVVSEDIYKKIASYYIWSNNVQIRNAIKYAIDNRNEQKTIANFEKIFEFEYDKYLFTNKTIIEEIARVINDKT